MHVVRTSIRLIQASFSLLPKKLRRDRRIQDYLSKCQSVFRATTPLRDLDILNLKLKEYESNPVVHSVAMKALERRTQLLHGTINPATALHKIRLTEIKQDQLSDSKILRRRRKVIRRLDSRLCKRLRIVHDDHTNFEEIHAFRKDCKRLRYTLEFQPQGKKEVALIKVLRDLQATLGVLRDSDLTLQYIERNGLGGAVSEVVSELRATREKKYKEFLKILRKNFLTTLPKSIISDPS